MKRSISFTSLLAATFLSISPAGAASADRQVLELDQQVQIPDAVLQPGKYTISTEDHLNDRAIIRIAHQGTNEHYLFLGVPDANLPKPSARGGLLLSPANDDHHQIARGWHCGTCKSGVEFVYPKAQAAKIISETGNPVMAVDPEYDKLPGNLSSDDMKVVTLWLVTPKRVTPERGGDGLNLAKYVPPAREANTAVADTSAPAESTMAANEKAPAAKQLPHTASNTFNLALGGLLLCAMGYAVRNLRRRVLP